MRGHSQRVLFAGNRPRETKAVIPVMLISVGKAALLLPGLSAMGAPHRGGLWPHDWGCSLHRVGKKDHAPSQPLRRRVGQCIPAPSAAQASPDGHKCWSCHTAMSFPVPFLEEFSAGSVEGMRGFSIPAGLAVLRDKLRWLQGKFLISGSAQCLINTDTCDGSCALSSSHAIA